MKHVGGMAINNVTGWCSRPGRAFTDCTSITLALKTFLVELLKSFDLSGNIIGRPGNQSNKNDHFLLLTAYDDDDDDDGDDDDDDDDDGDDNDGDDDGDGDDDDDDDDDYDWKFAAPKRERWHQEKSIIYS